jgi:hypothetical protein
MGKPISAGAGIGVVLFVSGIAVGSGGSTWASHPRHMTVTRSTEVAVAEADASIKRGELRVATSIPSPAVRSQALVSKMAPPTPVATPTPSATPMPTTAPTPSATPAKTPEPSPSPTPTPSPAPAPSPSAPPATSSAPPPTPKASAPAPETKPVPPLVALAVLTADPNSTRSEKAQAWALAELDSPNPSWSDQLQAPWSGYCEAFVEIAYGTRHLYGTALADYRTQKAAGRVHTDTEPPAGALVFYGGGITGHVALSVGGGQVITTWGYAGQRYPVLEKGVRAFSNPYYGWADAPDTWPGR